MYDHLKQVLNNRKSKLYNRHKYYTIKQILVSNKLPIIEIMYDNLTEYEAFTYEKILIEKYKNQLTNMTNGGSGGDTLSNHPNKLSIYDKIKKSNTGKHHTAEYRKNMSIGRIGKNNPFYGKTHTTENRYKSGSSMRGKKQTTEHINAKKRSACYTVRKDDNNTILIFNSLLKLDLYFKKLCKDMKRSEKISGQLLRRYKSYKGYTVLNVVSRHKIM